MKVSVWDTYVRKTDGNVMHFDIVVPEEMKNPQAVYAFGQQYLADRGLPNEKLDTEVCQFCHLESPTAALEQQIRERGFGIIEMEEIPAQLPAMPSRRDMILHLRGHQKPYRFMDFSQKSTEEIREIIERR